MQTGQERRYVEQERWASGKEHLFQRSERRRVETQRRSSMHAAAMQHTQRAGERRGSTRRAREQPRRLLLQSWRCTASSGGRRRARTREPNLPCSGSRGRVLQQAQARKSETVIRCTSLCLHTPPLLSDLAPPNPVRPCCTSFLELATSQRDTLQAILVPGRYLRAHYSRRSQTPLGHAHLAPWNATRRGTAPPLPPPKARPPANHVWAQPSTSASRRPAVA